MGGEGREEGGPEEGRAAGAAGLVDEPVGAGAAGRQGQAPPRPQSGPQEEGEGACCGVAPAGGFGLGGSGCSRERVTAEREGMVRGGRRRHGEQIDDGKGRLQLAKLGEGRRRRRANR